MSVYKKLNEARKAFQNIALKKSGRNQFSQYDYFTLGDIVKPALQVFQDAGLCSVVTFDEKVATMTVIDVDKPEDRIVITSPMGSAALKGCHEVQNIGATETYQRRYLWLTALDAVERDVIEETTDTREEESADAYEEKWLQTLQDAAMEGMAALNRAFKDIPPSADKNQLWNKHGKSLKDAAVKAGA